MFIIIRIIAGKNKGCRLRTKEGLTTRPTLDRIRENVFNIIRDRIPGSHVLDLFAGSGAIGLECLSRGAESAVFIEKDREAFGILKENVAKTRQEARSRCFNKSYEAYLSGCRERFDLIYADPPYGLDAYEDCLVTIGSRGLLAEGGILVLESHKGSELPLETDHLQCDREIRYGNTKIWIYIMKQEGIL